MRTIINDYADHRLLRRVLLFGLAAATVVLLVLGTLGAHHVRPLPGRDASGSAPRLLRDTVTVKFSGRPSGC